MGASEARKDRRRNRDESSRSGPVQRKKVKLNRGRTEYRNVTRTAKRGFNSNQEDLDEEQSDQGSQKSEDDSEDEEAVDDVEKGQAYSALLNILTAEQDIENAQDEEDSEQEGEETSNGLSKDSVTGDESDESTEENDEVAGLVDADADDNDEEQEEEDEDALESDQEDLKDPFEYHFANSSTDYLDESSKLLEHKQTRWKNSKKNFDDYSCLISLPPTQSSSKYSKIPENNTFKDYNIRSKITDPFFEKNGDDFLSKSSVSKLITDPMFSYNDVLFPYSNLESIPDYRKLYSVHVLNHIYKTRDRILNDNAKLRIQSEKVANGELKPEDEKEFRDQGFTRPKVLILLPTRHHCYQVFQNLKDYSGCEQVENLKKFKSQFYEDSEVPDNKPDDFRNLFEGNTNDFFCIGAKFTRKSIKLYTSFYASDIILASPIGLQLILENPDKKKRQTDFLSSIEVLVVDQANAIELQNWDHVLTVLKYINKIPEQLHDTDFSRVRMWSIEDQAKFFTQSLIFTQYNTPNINNLLTRSKNMFGKYRFRALVTKDESAVSKVGLKIKQIFTRFDSVNPFDEPDERFSHFKSVIVPSLSKSTGYEDGLLLYIPSYTDYLRIQNYLRNKTSLLFCGANEYSPQKDLSRSRALFQQGRRKILLYTERLHHYRRFDLKGVKNILLYGVPNNPVFYTEIVSSIGRSVFDEIADFNISTVRCLYSKWDALALERVVGSDRAPVLTHGRNEFYEFR